MNSSLDDQVPTLGAALSYYTLFSIVPLLLIAVAIVGLAFGEQAARGEVVRYVHEWIGQQGAQTVQSLIAAVKKPSSGVIATAAGIITLLIGASGVFSQLQTSLNMIWRVTTKPGQTLSRLIRARAWTFAMVIGIAFLLLVSLLVSTALSAAGEFVGTHLPGGEIIWHIVNLAVSFAVITALFAMLFKALPDVSLTWRDVFIGAAVTSLLFSLGKFAIGLYLGHSGVTSVYGAASSLVALMVWIFYSSQILFFGAEFTKIYSLKRGHRPELKPDAVWIGAGVMPAPEASTNGVRSLRLVQPGQSTRANRA